MSCPIENCVCQVRRNPAALPKTAHRSRLPERDRAYRAALGVSGALPKALGTISHGGTQSARRRATRSNARIVRFRGSC